MASKPHISQTQLVCYEKCGEIYRRRYIEGEKIPPPIVMVKGSGVHGGSKANFSQKMESHKDLPAKDIIDISVSEFDNKLTADGILLTPDEVTRGYKNIVGEARDAVRVLSNLYAKEVAPVYQPQFVEQKHELELPNASHDLLMWMDICDEKDIIVDVKTGTKKRNQRDVDTDEQLSFYTLVFLGITGRMPASVCFECLLDQKKPKHDRLESTRTKEDLEAVVARINTMIHGLKKGIFMPAPAMAWWCSPVYCGFWRTCPYVKH